MNLADPRLREAVADNDFSPLLDAYHRVRSFSTTIVAPLEVEDCNLQSMPDASPLRWHLAHSTWFFETFVLSAASDYRPFDPAYERLFNSYYNTVGEQFPRAQRGLLSRPTLPQVLEYREHVDAAMKALLLHGELPPHGALILELGLQHEQQHQELMLTDLKHALSCNPLAPTAFSQPVRTSQPQEAQWVKTPEAIREIGYAGDGFCFDNERPRHRVLLEDYELRSHLVTNGEFLEFIADGGYERPEFWLSLGWSTVQEQQWTKPLYWERESEHFSQFTLNGLQPLDEDAPVCHVSYFEAEAFARWSGCRLPTEAEWEAFAQRHASPSQGADDLLSAGYTPQPAATASGAPADGVADMFGEVWEWTASQYTAYPGYRPPAGALGEYNGKFMCNQFVLKGGSCASPAGHVRPSYRNFFPPQARWQFSGIRLCR